MFMRIKKFKKWSDLGLKELKKGYKDFNVIKNMQEVQKLNFKMTKLDSNRLRKTQKRLKKYQKEVQIGQNGANMDSTYAWIDKNWTQMQI